MLQFLHKILAAILAFIVLFSSFSFAIEQHICNDEIVNVSYISEIDSCDMHAGDIALKGGKEETDDCCFDNIDLIPGKKNVQEATAHLDINQVKFIVAYTHSFLNLYEVEENLGAFIDTSPNIKDKDFQVLYQTFLI